MSDAPTDHVPTAPPATRGAAPQGLLHDVPRAARLREQAHRQWMAAHARGALWVFGYASLIWRPEYDAAERHAATVHGWHRALRMRSRINRGTPETPGLVFALLSGGSCRGVVDRLQAADDAQADARFAQLWAREMPTGVYEPRWLPCRTAVGVVHALAFTLDRRSDACLPPLQEEQMLQVLRHARGRYGTTLEYLAETAEALRTHGVRDAEVERLMRLARAHALWPARAPHA